jgi:SprT protein
VQLEFNTKLMQRFTRPAAAEPVRPIEAPVTGLDAAAELARAREVLRAAGAEALAQQVAIRWNPRMRSTAGTANSTKCQVHLNPQLRKFGAAEVERTLLHELAHLLAQHRAGRRRIPPHGHEWRRACEDLGLKDEPRCHDLPLPRRQQERRYRYRCPGCGMEVRRARPLRRRTACLACCRCHNGGRYDERFRFAAQPK